MKHLLFLIILISNTVYANEKLNCEFNWNIQVSGVAVGKLKDNFTISENYYKFNSLLKPNQLFSILGISQFESYIEKNSNVISKEDIKTNKKNQEKTFYKIDSSKLMITKNNNVTISNIDTEDLILDANNYKYISFLDNKKNINVSLIGKSSIYKGTLSKKDNKINFNSEGKSGFILIENNIPKYFQLKDEDNTVIGERENYTCSSES